jgi:hypothetical protein
MIHTVKAVRTLQAVASFLGLALLLWSLGIPMSVYRADAANLTSVSDTLSTSGRGVSANHTIKFTSPNGAITGQDIVITFPVSTFTLPSGLDFNDMDVTVGNSEITLGSSPSGTTWGVSTTTTSITFNTSSTSGATIGSSTVVVIKIGSHATTGTTGDTQLVNPAAAGSVEITIGGTIQDSGATRVAIVDDVVVSANVDTSLTFTISGVAIGQTVNGSPTTTSTTSSATSVAFGTLATTSKVVAQDLAVVTNASNGFVVTVQQTQNLLSSTGADIDGFANGNYQNTPIAWTNPSSSVSDERTWGHWGITSEDDLNTNEFGSDLWVAASTTPRQVFQNSGPSDGTTANNGSTRVGYQAQVSPLQEAGDDYTTRLIYVVTPTF